MRIDPKGHERLRKARTDDEEPEEDLPEPQTLGRPRDAPSVAEERREAERPKRPTGTGPKE